VPVDTISPTLSAVFYSISNAIELILKEVSRVLRHA